MGMDTTGFPSSSFLAMRGTPGGTQENTIRSKYRLKSRRFLTWAKISRTMKWSGKGE